MTIEKRIAELERQAALNDKYETACRKSGAEYMADQHKGAAHAKRLEAARLRKQAKSK